MRKFATISLFLTIVQLSFGQNTILWRVTEPINNKTSFILGTFHLIGNSFVDSIPEIKENLYRSEIAIFESTDQKGEAQKIINSRPEGNELKKRLKKRDYLALLKLSQNWEVDIYKLTPRELSWKLEREFLKTKCVAVSKKDEWELFDYYLQHLAKEKGIKLLGLETDKEQLVLIDRGSNSPNWKGESKKISYWIDQLDRDDFNKNNCNFVERYRNYDLDYKLQEECVPSVLLKERNDSWMKVLPQLLKDNNCFVAVGLSHLYNKCGLLEQLKEEGFLIEPIELSPAGNTINSK